MSDRLQTAKSRRDEIQPWDSDHTALVHVLWDARRGGLIDRDVDCDAMASLIMRSKWLRAVREHAKGVRPAPRTNIPLPEVDDLG